MPASPRPSLRWFRFRYGLRTLFVVMTLLACWLGYESWIVRLRRETLERIEARGAGVLNAPWARSRPVTIPRIRAWMGDVPIALILCDVDTFSENERAQLQGLFSEAWVVASDRVADTHFRTE